MLFYPPCASVFFLFTYCSWTIWLHELICPWACLFVRRWWDMKECVKEKASEREGERVIHMKKKEMPGYSKGEWLFHFCLIASQRSKPTLKVQPDLWHCTSQLKAKETETKLRDKKNQMRERAVRASHIIRRLRNTEKWFTKQTSKQLQTSWTSII